MPALPAADACAAQVFIEPKALMFLLGTEMDFVDDRLRSEFVFHNPNSKGECGECCPVASLTHALCPVAPHITQSDGAVCSELLACRLWGKLQCVTSRDSFFTQR